jgi:ribose transport system substrate-binding protein
MIYTSRRPGHVPEGGREANMRSNRSVERLGRWRSLIGFFAVMALVLAACGGADGPAADTMQPDEAGGDEGDLFAQTVDPPPGDKEAQLEFYKNWAQEAQQPATFESFGGEPPVPIAENKRITIIICTAEGQGCVLQGEGAAEAVEAVGWESVTIDGQGSSQAQSNAIRQAIAQGFDGIYMAVVDRNSVAAAIAEANEAGMPVVTSISGNTPGGDLFWSVDAPDFEVGRRLAAWAIAEEDGEEVKAAAIYLSLAGVNLFRAQGFVAQMKACDWCTLVGGPQSYTIDGLEDLPARVSSIIQANPDINYIFMDVGPWVTFVVQGMEAVGDLAKEITILSTDCVPDQLSRMAGGGPFREICDGYASLQAGWGAVDELNRAMQGLEPGGNKVAIQLFTSDTIDQIEEPLTIGYDVDNLDYRQLYLESWGLE